MSAENALADLGLDLDGAVAAEAPVAAAPVTETETSEGGRTFATVKISDNDIDIDEDGGELPALVRAGFGSTGPRGSKYPFDKLEAPVEVDGAKRYKSFTVRVPEGEELERVVRSVQSATTNANRTAKEAGEATYFVTRAFNDAEGKQVGIKVFRTDERPVKEDK